MPIRFENDLVARLPAINANLLVALDALLEHDGVGAAARAIGLSQPAMSNALAQLRVLLGDPLLVRAGNRMRRTPRAEALRAPLRAALETLEAVVAPPDPFDPARCDESFRVAMADLAELSLVPPLLARLHAQAPRATLQVLPGPLLDVAGGVGEGSVDASIGIVQGDVLPPGLHRRRLFPSRLVGIVRRGHPALRADRMPLRTYVGLDHVIVTERPDATTPIDDALARRGLARRIAARVPRATLVPPLLAASNLVAAVSDTIATPFARWLPLVIFPLPVALPAADVSLVWHERTAHDPARDFLRRLIAEAAAEAMRASAVSPRPVRPRSA
jgi:DNA-binding transcriptional LysR family regulator